MALNTASEVISFARKLEETGAQFYEDLARLYDNDTETLLSFAGMNRKSIIQIERTYYGVISDALEGGFAFEIEEDLYTLPAEPPGKTGYREGLNRAVEIERKIKRFYEDAAGQSKPLMADVPRAFSLAARKRESRIATLESLIENSGQP
ncbi:MAG TPA: hypothetical protein VMX75_14115 [Spirochaetia bacterium]|nr:hypothetical protein [Spirochaetia bacterium]